ncbi:MAG: SURF1 family cytochrome oxidase biogenesis protein [Hyphomonas oceanitis]|uniref:SURF1 family cytochrome oxidase biogenesis protein n=1 Tax=Hyphomonas oceanitis TaxID=81033 RepID=UPI003002DCF8
MSFRPLPVLTFFTLVSLVILVLLGNWQYRRFSEKMALDNTPIAWTNIDGNVVPGSEAMVYSYTDGSAAWRRVVAIDTGEEVVFTPIEVLYQVDPPQPCLGPACGAGLRFAARGLYQSPRGRNAFTGTDSPEIGIFYTLDPAVLGALLPADDATRVHGRVFEPDTIQLTENGRSMAGENPFARARPDSELPPQRHFGYAITWWGLAMALLGVYLAFHYQKGRLRFRKGSDA